MGLASWELFSAPLAKGQALAVSFSFAFLTLGEEFFEAWALRAYGSSCTNTIPVRVLAVSEHLQRVARLRRWQAIFGNKAARACSLASSEAKFGLMGFRLTITARTWLWRRTPAQSRRNRT